MRRFHIQQGGRDDEKLSRAGQVRRGLHEGNKLVRDLRERDLGNVELLACNQRKEKIEGPLENRE